MSDDEYDSYNLSEFSITDLAAVDSIATTSTTSTQASLAYPSPHPEPPATQPCDESDEYDEFDLTEFSAADLACVDSTTATLVNSPSQAYPSPPSEKYNHATIASIFNKSRDISRTSSLQTTPSLTSSTESTSSDTRYVIEGPSPYSLFRAWRKTLSVSDLVGPLWCEVQYDYGLRQRRWIELEKRPTSFLTADNNVIQVNQKIAADNDRTLKSGSAIHEKLERRLRPDVVEVQVMNESERWALRLLQMIACLADIQTYGFCREMPSFGILHGHLVNGIIDEVGRKPWITNFRSNSNRSTAATGPTTKRPLSTPSSPRKPKKARPSLPAPAAPATAQQTRLTTFVGSSRAAPAAPNTPSYALHLSDTKTRRKQTIPSDDDATSARLQLMIYQRLLVGVMSPSFPWAAFWARLGVDPLEPLCDEFLEQALPLLPGADKEKLILKQYGSFPRTLTALVAAFHKALAELHVVHVDRTLEIVYRSQRSTKAQKRAAEDAALLQAALEQKLLQEEGADPELARMIAAQTVARKYPPGMRPEDAGAGTASDPPATRQGASLSGVAAKPISDSQETIMPVDHSDAVSHSAAPTDVAQDREILPPAAADAGDLSQIAIAASSKPTPNPLADVLDDASIATVDDLLKAFEKRKDRADEEATGEESRIIGTKTFELDDELLDTHLTHVFAFWMGDRPPEGVSEENARRCSNCEYMDGCEWREKKAREIEEKLGFKRPVRAQVEVETGDTTASMF
ncbi:hypothetical protein PENSPDRAFT_598720 [Peniophora sp. CONT]|nr:hypothetical protein PENSPDRAFT_598720 [Peniophora sp. CONT]